MISHSASGRVGFWDGSSMSQLATLMRAATHYPPSMSQLATTIRAATHILETQLLEPEFATFEGTKEVRNKDHLQITGKRLSDGLGITDYKITIGIGICAMVDLTSKELICEIPEEKGQQEEDEHSVLVHPGTNLSPQLIGTVHLLIISNLFLF